MTGSALLEFSAAEVESGQRQIADNLKRLVARSGCPLADRLDYSLDFPFLEPCLFTHFLGGDSPVPLEQLLLAYVGEDQRPETCTVHADERGDSYLPRLGCLSTPGAADELVQTSTSLWREAAAADSKETVIASRPRMIAGCDAELRERFDPLLASVFRSNRAEPDSIALLGEPFATGLERALVILEQVAPVYSNCIRAVTRQIILFRHDANALHSFAAFVAHGAAFLHVPDDADEVFFVEDVAHQCGHGIFNAMTLDRGQLLRVEADLPLPSDDPNEHRTVYVALHGVYTECLMSLCLSRCLTENVFAGRQRHELLGRLSLILRRLSLDLPALRQDGLFTPEGEQLVREFERMFAEIFATVQDKIVQLDLRNQPYEFCYQRFAAANPEK